MGRVVLASVASALLISSLAVPASAQQPQPSELAVRLSAAAATQAVAWAKLGVLGDAFTCGDARLVSYRRSTAEPDITDQWYVASQLWADAALVALVARLQTGQASPVELLPPNWNSA